MRKLNSLHCKVTGVELWSSGMVSLRRAGRDAQRQALLLSCSQLLDRMTSNKAVSKMQATKSSHQKVKKPPADACRPTTCSMQTLQTQR